MGACSCDEGGVEGKRDEDEGWSKTGEDWRVCFEQKGGGEECQQLQGRRDDGEGYESGREGDDQADGVVDSEAGDEEQDGENLETSVAARLERKVASTRTVITTR